MNRSQRRAAERLSSPAPAAAAAPQPEISEARLAANRANAQHSTGPTTPSGKATVSLNAVKTGLTGRTVLLTSDDAVRYESLILRYQTEFKPVGPWEETLVQSITDTIWRLDRIPGILAAINNIGNTQLLKENPQLAALTPGSTNFEVLVRERYEKQIRNLELQENRLIRRRDKEMAELMRLQAARKTHEAEQLKQATQASLVARHQGQPFDLAALGFEFSAQRLDAHLARLTPAAKQTLLDEALGEHLKSRQATA